YTHESVCFYSMRPGVRLVRSREGARIGCRMGSFSFALAVQDLYETLQNFLDMSGTDASAPDGSFVKAAMDDCIFVLRAGGGGEEAFYRRVARVVGLIDKGGEKIGLSFVNDK